MVRTKIGGSCVEVNDGPHELTDGELQDRVSKTAVLLR